MTYKIITINMIANTIIMSRILTSFVLSLPVLCFLLAHHISAINNGLVPTWFYFYDMPYYLANAHQYIDGQSSFIYYSNPFDFNENSPRIYFQPLIYFFGLLLGFDFIDPGFAFIIVGYLITLAAFYILQIFLDKFCPTNGFLRIYILSLVIWGGGCLVLLSVFISYILGADLDFFIFDPSDGWWCLNFGRNFLIPTEAFYHIIVLLIYYSVLQRQLRAALLLLWVLVISHPFTGIQYSLIMLLYVLFEHYFMKSRSINRTSIILFATPLLFCILYYIVYLPSFENHRVLMNQWTLGWSYKWQAIFGGYCLVGLLAFMRFRNIGLFLECFKSPFNRFLFFCASISFILANHEFLFINPTQPLHFTRGHIWTPICLLGLPFVVDIYNRLRKKSKRSLMILIIASFGILMISDNFIWFANKYINPEKEFMLTPTHMKIINYLNTRNDAPIIISNDVTFGYLSPIFTNARPYYGHMHNTPYPEQKLNAIRMFFTDGVEPYELMNKKYLLITRRYNSNSFKDDRFTEIFSTGDMSVFERISTNHRI